MGYRESNQVMRNLGSMWVICELYSLPSDDLFLEFLSTILSAFISLFWTVTACISLWPMAIKMTETTHGQWYSPISFYRSLTKISSPFSIKQKNSRLLIDPSPLDLFPGLFLVYDPMTFFSLFINLFSRWEMFWSITSQPANIHLSICKEKTGVHVAIKLAHSAYKPLQKY